MTRSDAMFEKGVAINAHSLVESAMARDAAASSRVVAGRGRIVGRCVEVVHGRQSKRKSTNLEDA